MGLSTDQMAKLYFTHLKNQGLSVEDAALAANINVEEAKRLDVQEQIAKSVERISAVLNPVLEKVAGFLENGKALGVVFAGLAVIIGGQLAVSLLNIIKFLRIVKLEKIKSVGLSIADYAIQAAKAVAGIPVVGPFLAFAAGAAAGAAGNALYNKFAKKDDFLLPAVGGSGYGKRMISAPEGTFALNNKDTIIAGTNLFPKANDVLSPPSEKMTRAPEGTFALDTSQKSATPINLDETNSLLKQLIFGVNASRNTVVEIDGNKLLKIAEQNKSPMG